MHGSEGTLMYASNKPVDFPQIDQAPKEGLFKMESNLIYTGSYTYVTLAQGALCKHTQKIKCNAIVNLAREKEMIKIQGW